MQRAARPKEAAFLIQAERLVGAGLPADTPRTQAALLPGLAPSELLAELVSTLTTEVTKAQAALDAKVRLDPVRDERGENCLV